MIRRLIYSAIVAGGLIALPFASVAPAYAVGPTGTYSTGITCVNLSTTSSASLAITFYSQDNGTAVTTYSVPSALAPKSNVVLFTPSIPGLPSSLQGSAVVSSDQQVSCTADSQRSDGTPGTSGSPARIATSESFDASQAASTLYASQVVKALGNAAAEGQFNSYVAVQNIESAPVTVTMSYVDRFGNVPAGSAESVVIPAQASHYFYQSANANLNNGFLGSATIAASDPIRKLAATVVIYNDGTVITRSQMQAYNAAGSGSNTLLIPQFVRNYYGYNTGANIVNIGATTTTVTATYTYPGPNVYTQTLVIGPKKVAGIYAPNIAALAGVDSLANNLRTGAAVLQAGPGGTIVANVNMDNRGTCSAPGGCGTIAPNSVGFGQSLNSFQKGTETTKAIISRYPRRFGGEVFNGGFVIANATANAGTCDIEFVGTPAANQTSVTLNPNGTIGRFSTSVANLTDGTNNPVSIVCTQPVFVSANSRSDLASYLGDSGSSWNVMNIP